MGITERRTRQKEEVKSLILDAAWKQIQGQGCLSLSIRKVADAIEYSVPVIYSHFESKEALMAEFVRKGYGLLVEELEKAKASETEASAQLRAIGRTYCAFAVQNREYYQLMFGLGIPVCETIRQLPEISAFSELVRSTIREIIAGSKHPGADDLVKFKTFWALLHGLISINMSGALDAAAYSRVIWEDAVQGFIFALRG